MPLTREDIDRMSPEEKQEFVKQAQAKLGTSKPTMMQNVGSGLKRGGLQVLKDLPYVMNDKLPPEEDDTTGKINAMIATEKAKRELLPKTPQEQLASMELEEIQRKKQGMGGDVPIPSIGATPPRPDMATPATPTMPVTPITPVEETPPMFIEKPKGKNKYGIMEYETVDNPEYKRWSSVQEDKEKSAKQDKVQSRRVKDYADDALKTIGEVKKGIGNFGAIGPIPTLNPWDYDRKAWEANVNKLLAGKIIDVMTSMKEASKTGATGFGQLSEKELKVLQEASTALNRGLSPEYALRLLADMEEKLNKVLSGASSDVSNKDIPQFATEQEAEASGYKGEAVIGGRPARID